MSLIRIGRFARLEAVLELGGNGVSHERAILPGLDQGLRVRLEQIEDIRRCGPAQDSDQGVDVAAPDGEGVLVTTARST